MVTPADWEVQMENQTYFLFFWKSCSKQVRLIEYFNLANDLWHWTLRVAQKDLERELHSQKDQIWVKTF